MVCFAQMRMSLVIEANRIEQYGHRENVTISRVEEEPREDILAKVVIVAEKAGVPITNKTRTSKVGAISKAQKA